jgi:hypothetical protein
MDPASSSRLTATIIITTTIIIIITTITTDNRPSNDEKQDLRVLFFVPESALDSLIADRAVPWFETRGEGAAPQNLTEKAVIFRLFLRD